MAVGDPIFFGRKYRLTLDPPDGKSLVIETEEGLPAMDIKFDVTYARGQTAREGKISILGLGYDTMHTYMKLAGMTRGMAMSKLVHVRLDAGYFTAAGMVNILDGFVWHCTISSPPTMWLELEVSEYNPLGGRKFTFGTTKPLPMKRAVEEVLKKFSEVEGQSFTVEDQTEGLKLDKSTKRVSFPFASPVTIGEAINFMNNQFEDVQFVLKTSKDDANCRMLIAVDKKWNAASDEEDVVVDGDNGLLSVTGIDAINGCITTFLDGRITDALSHLRLKSVLNPQANGRYYICKKQFVGHYMGQEWYSRYFCTAREGDDLLEKENQSAKA